MIRIGVILSLLTKLSISQGQTKIYNALFNYADVSTSIDSSWISKVKTGKKQIPSEIYAYIINCDVDKYSNYLKIAFTNLISERNKEYFISYTLSQITNQKDLIVAMCNKLQTNEFLLTHSKIDFYKYLACIIINSLIYNPNNSPDSENDYVFDDDFLNDSSRSLLPSNFSLTTNPKSFENMFRKVDSIEFIRAKKTSKISLYSLNLDVNRFEIHSFDSYIEKRLGEYALSRIKLKNLVENNRERAINTIASNYIKKNNSKREAMGFLLYEFLENDLQAPKIFNGIEIGTINNDLSHCDGVYLLKTDEEFQLVFGTSDIQSSIYSALDNAFFYAKELFNNRSENVRFINTSILSKSFDPETANYLKKIMIPTPETQIQTNYSIGIFVGYTFNFDKQRIMDFGFQEIFETQMRDDLIKLEPLANELIDKYSLYGINCYLYILPFNNAEEDNEYLRKTLRQENIYE